MVTTEEFERGLEILARRQQHRASGGRIHDDLLRGLAYVQLENGTQMRLTGSIPKTKLSTPWDGCDPINVPIWKPN